ncbi:oxidoreductase [Allorhizocola rhizosphaerae]|uniref:oxidoreductase n=1 Tax=Allorhizocola rhizosphaerae TaxID=1872709 RepID=UPI0014783136|nr:oxidoreductase [Allorhizocola rhizosphaerae]
MDPLAPLLNLTDIESAVKGARDAVDGAYRHPSLRREGGAAAAEIALRSAVASASLDFGGYDLELVRAGAVHDGGMQGALRLSEALPTLASKWESAPRQVLAKLHVLAGTGVVDSASLGRPSAPLDQVCAYVVNRSGDPLIRAAVVHGEMLALNPFPGVNGLVARAAARLTLVSSAFDPRGIIPVEEIHLEREPEYRGAALAFATGTTDGIRSWLKHYALAITLAANSVASSPFART